MYVSNQEQYAEYMRFKVDMLNAKHKGAHTEKEIVEKLIQLVKSDNIYAKRAVEEASREFSPNPNLRNSFWKESVTHGMTDVASTSSTITANTDESGLWRHNTLSRLHSELEKFK